MRTRKLLHLIETSEPGGAETIVSILAEAFNSGPYRSLVVLLEKGWLSEKLAKSGIPFLIIQNKYSFDPFFLLKLVLLVRKEKIDIMHSHEFTMNVYGSLVSFITRVPIIATVHGKVYYPEKNRRILFYRMAAKLCSGMIAVSNELKRYLLKELKLNSKDIMVVYNGIDLDKFHTNKDSAEIRKELSIPPETLIVGSVGSLFKVKGYSFLIESAKEVLKVFPNFKLLILGEGEQSSALQEKIESAGLQDAVKLLGFREDIPKILTLFDIYVCSSLSEGLSLSLLEAMAAEKPIIATEVGGNSEIVINGVSGFLVPPENPNALAEKIIYLLKDKEKRKKMGEEGRRIVKEKFSIEQMLKEYENLYEKLLKR